MDKQKVAAELLKLASYSVLVEEGHGEGECSGFDYDYDERQEREEAMNRKADRQAVAQELVRIARSLIAKDNVFAVKQGSTYTLWFAYGPGSGRATLLRGEPKGYITDRSSDKKFDSLAKDFAKKFPADKVIPLGIYDYVSSQERYDVFGGDMKPFKRMYAVIKRDDDIVVNFFDKKGEASYWAKN